MRGLRIFFWHLMYKKYNEFSVTSVMSQISNFIFRNTSYGAPPSVIPDQRISRCSNFYTKWTFKCRNRCPHKAENVALLSEILWSVGPPFCGAPARQNMLNMPKSASECNTLLWRRPLHPHLSSVLSLLLSFALTAKCQVTRQRRRQQSGGRQCIRP